MVFETYEIRISNFWDFVPEDDNEREYVRDVFALYEKARDFVLDKFDAHGVVFLDEVLGKGEAWDDACSIFLHDLASRWAMGESTIFGEWVGQMNAAINEEIEYLKEYDLPTKLIYDPNFEG